MKRSIPYFATNYQEFSTQNHVKFNARVYI